MQDNQRIFRRLVAFLQFSEGLTIGIIEANVPQDIDVVLTALQQHPNCSTIQFEVLNFDEPQQRFPRKEIIETLPPIHLQSDKKRVVVLRDWSNPLKRRETTRPSVWRKRFHHFLLA